MRAMSVSFHLIAYETMAVCNAIDLATLEGVVERANLPPGASALDLGTGNGAVAVALARRFGLQVQAVERDPALADLARRRALEAGVDVTVTAAASAEILAATPPVDLIVAMGATDVVGGGRLAPVQTFARLKPHLKPGGWLLWGDLTWIAELPAPVRQLAEASALYADDAGWRAAAQAAGFSVVHGHLSSDDAWDAYAQALTVPVREWMDANAEASEADAIQGALDRISAFFTYGRPYARFGLYLLQAG